MPSPTISSSARSSSSLECCLRSRARSRFFRKLLPDVDMRSLLGGRPTAVAFRSRARNVRSSDFTNHQAVTESGGGLNRSRSALCGIAVFAFGVRTPTFEIVEVRVMRNHSGSPHRKLLWLGPVALLTFAGAGLARAAERTTAEPAPAPECKSAGVTVGFVSGSTRSTRTGKAP